MVIRPTSCRAMLTTELVVAMAILFIALIPLAYSVSRDQLACRAYYQRAVAMEIVDGEMEILLAGEWQAFKEGRQGYPVTNLAVTNLGKGEFILTRSNQWIRLEWRPAKTGRGGRVVREGVGK